MKFALALALGLALAAGCGSPAPPPAGRMDLARAMSDSRGEYASVKPGRAFRFPEDHGAHPEFKTEWWYVTGHLKDPAGRTFGYQITFFSTGLPSPGQAAKSPWSASRAMMAHLAVSNPSEQSFQGYERFSREALQLAGVESGASGLKVWLEDWSLHRSAEGQWSVRAREHSAEHGELSLELQLQEDKPPLLQGDGGYSRKGPNEEHSSYYVSLTRMSTRGQLEWGDQVMQVTGSSWFDHEWSSQALAPGLVGWDWFSLQLDDGWELMVYLLRYDDGRLEPASSGVLVDPKGGSTTLKLEELKVQVTDRYRSAQGVDYPIAWTVEVPGEELRLAVAPLMREQEMKSSVPYWEGAVTCQGTRNGRPIRGAGFVEMTGYDKR